MSTRRPAAVTFDFGQTLADLDTAMLSSRLGERGISVPAARLEGAVPAAWRAYNESIQRGLGGHPWKILMGRLLTEAGVPESAVGPAVDWLWDAQPTRNLWRRPVPGMLDIAKDLRAAGVPIGVLSNSEGRLAELINELGWTSLFEVVADSGKLGMEKPDRPIFDWTAARLGVPIEDIVHIGDSYAADVMGALSAGARAIWFGSAAGVIQDPRAASCKDAAEVRAALAAWGLQF